MLIIVWPGYSFAAQSASCVRRSFPCVFSASSAGSDVTLMPLPVKVSLDNSVRSDSDILSGNLSLINLSAVGATTTVGTLYPASRTSLAASSATLLWSICGGLKEPPKTSTTGFAVAGMVEPGAKPPSDLLPLPLSSQPFEAPSEVPDVSNFFTLAPAVAPVELGVIPFHIAYAASSASSCVFHVEITSPSGSTTAHFPPVATLFIL